MPLVGQTSPRAPKERIGYEVNYGAPRERVGYSVNYDVPRSVKMIERDPFWRMPRNEARLGMLMFGGGVIWATKVQTQTIDFTNIFHLITTPGPLEISAIGLLIWLHAMWRKSIRVR